MGVQPLLRPINNEADRREKKLLSQKEQIIDACKWYFDTNACLYTQWSAIKIGPLSK